MLGVGPADRCQTPADMALPDSAHSAGCRWRIKACFQEGKQNLDLGDYEGCSRVGWQRHTILCMPACFLRVRLHLGLKNPVLTVQQLDAIFKAITRQLHSSLR